MGIEATQAIIWRGSYLQLLDQRLLPLETKYLDLLSAAAVAKAITDMVVRGAPAIGISAAYGVAMAARARFQESPRQWLNLIQEDLEVLARARPTAVNLMWAIERIRRLLPTLTGNPFAAVVAEAERIHAEDVAANRRMGDFGASLISSGSGVLTHCNAGALATGGYGTALGVIRSANTAGKLTEVFADETRPWLQGARLTAWELLADHIPVTLIAEGAASHLMKLGKIAWVIVGSDRIAANGDVANKIGTYNLAVTARYHGVKFMVAAPTSTVDMAMPNGDQIPIEERDPEELLCAGGKRIAAKGAKAWNPVFDVTPASLVDAIVTERGIVEAPTVEKMTAMMKSGG